MEDRYTDAISHLPVQFKYVNVVALVHICEAKFRVPKELRR